MSKVLIELEKSDSTTEYIKASFTLVFKELDTTPRFKFLTDINNEDLNWCDVYLAVRPFTPLSLRIAKAIKEINRFYAVFYDDDLVNYKAAIFWRTVCAKKCISLSDIVLSSNPLIAKEYAELHDKKRSVVVDTPVCAEEILIKRYRKEKIHFVYAAGSDHAAFFEKQVKPILNDFFKLYSTKVHFTFIGVKPDLGDVGFDENITFIPLLSFDEYIKFMKESNFNIGFAPLDNTYFANRKYFNKYIEYTKFGILGMYSNTMPYTLIVKDKENGILVDNSSEAWYQALCFCIENVELCQKYLKAAQLDLKENFSVKKFRNTIKTMVPEFQYYPEVKEVINWQQSRIQCYIFTLADKLYKFIYSLKARGIKQTFLILKSYCQNYKKTER